MLTKMEEQKYVYFWKPTADNGHFSNWAFSPFIDDNGLKFKTTEQHMMYYKAKLFNDDDIAKRIISSYDEYPAFHRKLGRMVKGFKMDVWREHCEEIVYEGNLLKYMKHEHLRKKLLDTGNAVLAEASPYDRLWGIGYERHNALENISNWGENLLGKVLMRVRKQLQQRCNMHDNSSAMPGTLQWRKDGAWDKPLVETKGRERFDDIDTWLDKPGLLCRIYGGEYVFVDTSNCWSNLGSSEAMSRINSLVGITNATVNYEKAIRAFIKYIVKRCNARVGKTIPTSVCIGTLRLELELDRDAGILKFQPSRPLLDRMSSTVNAIVASVCIMPIDTVAIPEVYRFPGVGDIVHHLSKLFPDTRDLMTILWHVGNCLVDPVSRPKSVMLCGPGGSGKSTLLQQVYTCLIGCCGILPDGSLTGYTKSMHPDIAEVIAGSRMAICYDVELEKDNLNMGVFKNISGSDYIRVGAISCKTNCSLTLATNGIVDVEKQPQYHTDAIMRRVVCVLMNVAALSIPQTIVPEDPESRMDFICFCIYVRLMYDNMPVSPMSLLLTLCASKIDDVLQYVTETSEEISDLDGIEVLRVLSTALGFRPDEILFKAKLISPITVIKAGDTQILRGLRPK